MANIFNRVDDQQSLTWADKLGDYFKTAPALPTNIVELFVKFAPYLAVIGAVMILISGPIIGIFGTLGSLFLLNPLILITTIASVVIMLAQMILYFMAFKPLQDRTTRGWMLMFWAQVLQGIILVVDLIRFNVAGLLVGAIFLAIGFYVLYQMRPYYGPAAKPLLA